MVSSSNHAGPTASYPCRPARLLTLSLVLTPLAAWATEYPIGVNFGENAAYQLAPTETAGAPGFEQAHWNNLGRWGNATVLHDANGSDTAVSLKWDATGIWQSGANETLGGNNKLMKGYLDSNGTLINSDFNGVFGGDDDKPVMLVTGLDTWMTEQGVTSYSVVFYSEGDSDAGDRAARVWVAEADPANPVNGDPGLGTDLTDRVDIIDKSGWGANPTFVRVTGSSGIGNYTVFSGLTASSIYLRVDEAGSNPWRAPINGFQIVGTDVAIAEDSDSDGLPDIWEIKYGLDPFDDGSVDPNNGPNGDPDNDGRTNAQEFNGGTAGSNPVKADTDDDGVDDGEEFTAGTDPTNPDTDGDELPDAWEMQYGLDPLDDGTIDFDQGANGDPDGELLQNIDEYLLGTDPTDADTDNDTYSDSAEDLYGVWASVNATGTNPLKPDSDDDGIPDGEENPDLAYVAGSTSGTDPNLSDTDGDGQNDRWEFLLGTDPTDSASKNPTVDLQNPSFELPDAVGTFLNQVPDQWSYSDPEVNEVFVENLGSIGQTGGEGLQYAGIQNIGSYLYQNAAVAFQPDTTYIVDLAGGVRGGFGTGIVEFGLFSSDEIGTPVGGYPGQMDLDGIREASGNPDADNALNRLRDATSLATIGSGSLGRPYVLVTGSTAPTGNLVVYIRHVSGMRVMFDNIRIIAIPNGIDSDSDGLPDGWELASNLSPEDDGTTLAINGPNGDPDLDGSINSIELSMGTNPRSGDTDGDGLGDSAETGTGIFVNELDTGTSPTLADSDGDGFGDLAEILAGSDPNDVLDVPATAAPSVAEAAFNGESFEITVNGLDPAKTYTLARSTTLIGFTAIGDPVTGNESFTFTDDAPPEDRAFYVIEEVTTP